MGGLASASRFALEASRSANHALPCPASASENPSNRYGDFAGSLPPWSIGCRSAELATRCHAPGSRATSMWCLSEQSVT